MIVNTTLQLDYWNSSRVNVSANYAVSCGPNIRRTLQQVIFNYCCCHMGPTFLISDTRAL